MPLQFAAKRDFTSKLSELLLEEAECNRLSSEMIAVKDVSFIFEERREIYSRMRLYVPKKYHEFIRQQTVLSVVIREVGTGGKEFIGTGVVKKIELARNQPCIAVIL